MIEYTLLSVLVLELKVYCGPDKFYSGQSSGNMIRKRTVLHSHFRLLLCNRLTEFNETWQKASQRPLPSLCFSSQSEKQDGCPCLWLADTFLTAPLKPLNRMHQNFTGSKISMSSTTFVFFGRSKKAIWQSRPRICWDSFDFSSETAEHNSTKLDRKQDLNDLYQVFVFRADGKIKMASRTLIGWDIILTSPLKLLKCIKRHLTLNYSSRFH